LIFLFGQIIALPIIMQAVTVIGSAGQSYTAMNTDGAWLVTEIVLCCIVNA
jgi:hypothetical protein